MSDGGRLAQTAPMQGRPARRRCARPSHALDHYRDVAVAAGCDAFLSKPWAIEDFVAAVRRALAR